MEVQCRLIERHLTGAFTAQIRRRHVNSRLGLGPTTAAQHPHFIQAARRLSDGLHLRLAPPLLGLNHLVAPLFDVLLGDGVLALCALQILELVLLPEHHAEHARLEDVLRLLAHVARVVADRHADVETLHGVGDDHRQDDERADAEQAERRLREDAQPRRRAVCDHFIAAARRRRDVTTCGASR